MLFALVRLGAFLIDTMLVMLPTQLITLDYLKLSPMQAQIYFVILFALYGAVCSYAFQGRTAGKYVGKLVTVSQDGTPPSLLYLGLRELMKGMFFLPLVGPVLALISAVLYLWKGTTLPDRLGHTQVMLWKQAQRLSSQED